jgi:hypothetical protein
MAYDTTYLLDMIAKKAAIPQNQSTFDNEEILEVASTAIAEQILPDLLKSRQDFLVVYDDITPTQKASDNYEWIRIPYRSVGQSIISLCDPENDVEIDQTYYWVEGNKVYIDGNSLSEYRVRYHLRPSQLVETSSVGEIKSINRNTGEISVSSRPIGFTTALTYDFVKSAAGFDILARDLTCSSFPSVTGMIFTVADIPDELAVGDYVCLSDQSPVPQIPIEWFPFLASYTAASLLESLGDVAAAQKIESKLGTLRSNALNMVSPRVQNKSKPIIPRS